MRQNQICSWGRTKACLGTCEGKKWLGIVASIMSGRAKSPREGLPFGNEIPPEFNFSWSGGTSDRRYTSCVGSFSDVAVDSENNRRLKADKKRPPCASALGIGA
jgi:hypothetical protein